MEKIKVLRFILRDKPEQHILARDCVVYVWKVVQVSPQPSKEICGFEGSDHEDYHDVEVARALGGDYVEFLNEKYLDKGINEEWPIPDKKQHLQYHLKRATELAEEICLDEL